jgi:hypothetical protein
LTHVSIRICSLNLVACVSCWSWKEGCEASYSIVAELLSVALLFEHLNVCAIRHDQ